MVCQFSFGQQGLYISSGASLHNENSIITIVNGDFANASTTVLNGGTLQMKGLDDNTHRIALSNENTLDYLELYGSSSFELDSQLILNREIFMNDTSSFVMNTESFVTLGSTAEIVGESNTITGADGTYIKTTRHHTAGATNDFGIIGMVTYNGSTSMGSTEVYRRYGTFEIAGNPTANRYYEINPTVNSGLDIEAYFYLSDIDLNGLERSKLAAFRSVDNGLTFTNEGGTAETFFHSVSNIDNFSLWTFADASSLSIETTSDLSDSILIFPNPASYNVNIKPNKDIIITSIELYDISGRKIQTKLSNTNQLNVTNLLDGIYLLNIYTETGFMSKKLILKK